MKICEFTESYLLARYAPTLPSRFTLQRTPIEEALLVLKGALETVNQAGLDGKRLRDLTIVVRRNPVDQETIFQIHAKVEHRLAPRTEATAP